MSFIGKLIFGTQERIRKLKGKLMDTETAPAGAIYQHEARLNDGTTKKFSDYEGKVLLIVNVASECGYTPQYQGLESLYQTYQGRGLEILGFPSNEFGAQEPGSDAQIKEFCAVKFGASFPLFSKVRVKGADAHPLYKFLTTESGHNGTIPWNFSKFVVARDGRVAERFGPETEPESKELVGLLEALLEENA